MNNQRQRGNFKETEQRESHYEYSDRSGGARKTPTTNVGYIARNKTSNVDNNYDGNGGYNTNRHNRNGDGYNGNGRRGGYGDRGGYNGNAGYNSNGGYNGNGYMSRSSYGNRQNRNANKGEHQDNESAYQKSKYNDQQNDEYIVDVNENIKIEDKQQEYETIGSNVKEIGLLEESIDDFDNMPFLTDMLYKGICEYGFKFPSQIQSKTIHIINSGADLIAQSQSGSGKTGAFAIGSLSRINVEHEHPQVIIIANTRLLATQIMLVVKNISKFMKINVVSCMGGTGNSSVQNNKELKKAHVVVGTPGRICDVMKNNVFDGRLIKTMIMDESDVLLKDDFRPQIEEIVKSLGKDTQICVFSATFTKDTLETTEKFLRNPYRVTIEKEQISVKDVKQYKINVVHDRNKFSTLLDLYGKLTISQVIIFVSSIRGANELRDKLAGRNIDAGLIHGKMDGTQRETIIKEFRLSYIRVLISTDVMCRGIDVDDLRIVINYDMPIDPSTYLHRVGRSGRYGGQGIAINFSTNDDSYMFSMLKRVYDVDITDMPDPEIVNDFLRGIKPAEGKVLSSSNYVNQ